MITDEKAIEIALGVYRYIQEWGSNNGLHEIIGYDYPDLSEMELDLVCEVYQAIVPTPMSLKKVAKLRVELEEFYKE